RAETVFPRLASRPDATPWGDPRHTGEVDRAAIAPRYRVRAGYSPPKLRDAPSPPTVARVPRNNERGLPTARALPEIVRISNHPPSDNPPISHRSWNPTHPPRPPAIARGCLLPWLQRNFGRLPPRPGGFA